MAGQVRTVLSTDNGNEWRTVAPPDGARGEGGCRLEQATGEWRGAGGGACGLQLRLGRKLKGVPGKWELRQHKQVVAQARSLSRARAVCVRVRVFSCASVLRARVCY